jgi:CxxC motif-containing protein (DUF1111 family)
LRAWPWALATFALLAAANPELPDPRALTAGDFTTPEQGASAYSIPVAFLDAEQREAFLKGREQFNEAWVVAPDPSGVWGLGPTFNEDRCVHCHIGNGRAATVDLSGEAVLGMLVKLSIPGTDAHGGPNPHPVYGDQLQNRGIAGRVPAEGRAIVSYETVEVVLGDGNRVALRQPRVRLDILQFGDPGPALMTSLRASPPMIGLGLLEAVPEETLLAIARDQARQGVSGRPNRVWDQENARMALGRFGWKAGQPSLRQQTATAFLGDIGATSHFFPEENCPAAQAACRDVPSASKCGGQGGCTGNYRPEVVPSRLSNITLFLQALAVPARRNVDDADVARGESLFAQAGCNACHVPTLATGTGTAIAAASNLTIHPYTDLLLHDMGEGLADQRPEFEASGSEWRTAPLWGLGLSKTVSRHGDLLHDGRARNVVEAILWHGGEAQGARDAFAAMRAEDREALVKFVESL